MEQLTAVYAHYPFEKTHDGVSKSVALNIGLVTLLSVIAVLHPKSMPVPVPFYYNTNFFGHTAKNVQIITTWLPDKFGR